MDHTRIARQYEPELVALREAGYPADLSWGGGDAPAIKVDRPGGYVFVTDAMLGERLADRDTEVEGGWKLVASGDFNDSGAVMLEDDTVITEDTDAATLLAAIDLLTRRFFPRLDVAL
jgi:hypothetical protein